MTKAQDHQRGGTVFLTVVFVGILAIIAACYWSITNTEHVYKVESDKLPRKTGEANGCEVWKFKPDGRWLYFARCSDSTTETINEWEECREMPGLASRRICSEKSMNISGDRK